MKPNPFTEQRLKHQRTVDARYRRDLILVIMAMVGSVCALFSLAVFAKNLLIKMDNMPPEVVVIIIFSLACFLFFHKYARK